MACVLDALSVRCQDGPRKTARQLRYSVSDASCLSQTEIFEEMVILRAIDNLQLYPTPFQYEITAALVGDEIVWTEPKADTHAVTTRPAENYHRLLTNKLD